MRRISVCLALMIPWAATYATAQTGTPVQAQATFYSSGKFLKGSIPFNKHAAFIGRIMDGKNQLAMLELGRFVTFNLEPGEHTLAANSWMIASPIGGGHPK